MPRNERAPSQPPQQPAERPNRRLKVVEKAKPSFDEQLAAEPGFEQELQKLEGREAAARLEEAEARDAKAFEPFAKLAEAKIEDLPRDMKELRTSLLRALDAEEARGMTDAERMRAGLNRLKENKRTAKRAAGLEEQLRSFDFGKSVGPTPGEIAQLRHEMVRKGEKTSEKKTQFDKDLEAVKFDEELAKLDLEAIPATPIKKAKKGPTPEEVSAISKELIQKGEVEKPKAPKKREVQVERVVISPPVPQVAAQVAKHFLRTDALKSYVEYLEGHLKGKPDLSQMELPTGEKFSDINWTTDRIRELAHSLNKRLEQKEATSHVETLKSRIQEGPKDERARLESKLEDLKKDEADVKRRMAKIKESRSFTDRLRSFFGAKNKDLENYEEELKHIERQRNQIEEDLQMSKYAFGLHASARRGADIRAATQEEIAEKVRMQEMAERETTEEERGAIEKEFRARHAKAKQAGPTPQEVEAKVQEERRKSGWQPTVEEIPTNVKPLKKAQETKPKAELQKQPMNIDRAQELVPNAGALWNLADKQFKKRPEAAKAFGNASGKPTNAEDYAPTQYVFAIARYNDAVRTGDTEWADATLKAIEHYNDVLGIDEDSDEFKAAIAKKPKASRRAA